MNNNLSKNSNKKEFYRHLESAAVSIQMCAVSQGAALNKLRSLYPPYAPLDYERDEIP
jgi:hypothetical protein